MSSKQLSHSGSIIRSPDIVTGLAGASLFLSLVNPLAALAGESLSAKADTASDTVSSEPTFAPDTSLSSLSFDSSYARAAIANQTGIVRDSDVIRGHIPMKISWNGLSKGVGNVSLFSSELNGQAHLRLKFDGTFRLASDADVAFPAVIQREGNSWRVIFGSGENVVELRASPTSEIRMTYYPSYDSSKPRKTTVRVSDRVAGGEEIQEITFLAPPGKNKEIAAQVSSRITQNLAGHKTVVSRGPVSITKIDLGLLANEQNASHSVGSR